MTKVSLVLIFTVCLGSVSTLKAEDKNKFQPTKPIMNDIGETVYRLLPYVVNEGRFVDPKNDPELRVLLKKLSENVEKAKHAVQVGVEPFVYSRDVLRGHVREVNRVFTHGNKSYARWMLQSMFNICSSCHTQLGTESSWARALEPNTKWASDFDQAEFFFATRDYSKAFELYDKMIRGYPGNKLTTLQLETAFERQAAYFVKVKRTPQNGVDYMAKLQTASQVPEFLQNNAKAWAGLFRDWSKEKPVDLRAMNEAQFRKYVEEQLAPGLWDKLIDASEPRVITYLKVSTVLGDYLQTHPNTKLKAQIFLWLARCDRALNNNFFYSLADIYLRECIMRFSDSPVAVKCYEEYETSTMAAYSGSAGSFVPDEVNRELKRLKALVDKKQPKKE
ncbi:MAG: hypothetical protein IT289_06550 [Oligoflexia bacterium]|nr:hypothetical protein [Oligoflexia bacterium]